MPRSLAEGHTKLTICTTKPVNPKIPTIVELAAGIQAECNVMSSDFLFGATDSDKVAEKALCVQNNANSLGAGNYQAGFSIFRYWDGATLAADAVADAVFDACREKGTDLWVYARETAKDATAVWAEDDEIYLGAHVITDTPQPPSDRGGFIKRRVPMEVQEAWDDIVAADAP